MSGDKFGQVELGNFVAGQGKMVCIVQVAWLLFAFIEKKMKLHIQCMNLLQNGDEKESVWAGWLEIT